MIFFLSEISRGGGGDYHLSDKLRLRTKDLATPIAQIVDPQIVDPPDSVAKSKISCASVDPQTVDPQIVDPRL